MLEQPSLHHADAKPPGIAFAVDDLQNQTQSPKMLMVKFRPKFYYTIISIYLSIYISIYIYLSIYLYICI